MTAELPSGRTSPGKPDGLHPAAFREKVTFKNMSQERGSTKMEIFFALGFVVLWIALQAWILPRFGVST